MSVDYYIRLEQARGPRPSRQVLSALCRALLLTVDEREYLFRIADKAVPPKGGPSREVPASIRTLIDRMTDTPAYVVSGVYDILAWNRLATVFIGNEPAGGNMLRWMFAQPDGDPHWSDEDTLRFVKTTVADLRATYARYPGAESIESLVTELLGLSPRFAQMWAEHEVEVRRPTVKRIVHPQAGPLEFECQVLHIADTDQRLITYIAERGSRTETAFRELAANPLTRSRS